MRVPFRAVIAALAVLLMGGGASATSDTAEQSAQIDPAQLELITTAYQAAILHDEKLASLVLAPVAESEYDTYSSDNVMGPIIAVARENHDDAIVLVIPFSFSGGKARAVLFKGGRAVTYVGRYSVKSAADDLRNSLAPLPEALPAAEVLKGGEVRFKPMTILSGKGEQMPAYMVTNAGAPLIPLLSKENLLPPNPENH